MISIVLYYDNNIIQTINNMNILNYLSLQINQSLFKNTITTYLRIGDIYILYLEENNKVFIVSVTEIGLRRATFHLKHEITNTNLYMIDKFISYNFTDHYDGIEYDRWDYYEKCRIYKLTASEIQTIYNTAPRIFREPPACIELKEPAECPICLKEKKYIAKFENCSHTCCHDCMIKLINTRAAEYRDVQCCLCRA